MNAERLRTLAEDLLKSEKEVGLQSQLSELNNALQQLVSSPAHAQYQVTAAQALDQLETKVAAIADRWGPAELAAFAEIGAGPFFGRRMVADLRRAFAEQGMTPAVVQQQVEDLISRRETYLQQLRNTVASLDFLGIGRDGLEPGDAEIGFKIPRDLFRNELRGLIDELRAIAFIVRWFSELSGHGAEPAEVRQISTSDPQFFFGLSVETIVLIGSAVSWCLLKWREIEEIRKLRAETRKVGMEDLADEMEKRIKSKIEEAVAAKARELLGPSVGEVGRRSEIAIGLERALEMLLARVERGMTVELRCLPPPQIVNPDDPTASPPPPPEYQKVAELSAELSFPPPDPDPVLALPPAPPDTAAPGEEPLATGSVLGSISPSEPPALTGD